MIELDGRKVLVVGLGMSGLAAARLAAGLGARVTVIDASEQPASAGAVGELEALGVEVELGVDVPGDIGSYDLLVASPGVPGRAPPLKAGRDSGVKIISELELGYRVLSNDFVAVTGTNGKTTTTQLIGLMLSSEKIGAITCGNIGNPVTGLAGKVDPRDILVAEVSSFQLANIDEFHPKVAVLLNVAPDHYDWHADFEEYFAAKARVVENQSSGDTVVYNVEDAHCRAIALTASSSPAGFGGPGGSGIWVEDGTILAGPPLFDAGREIVDVGEVRIAGGHNLQNIMAAAGAALSMGAEVSRVKEVATTFEGLEHRMEPVGPIDGILFYNDSKATNPHASIHALASIDGPLVLILGGRNKGLDFSSLSSMISDRVAEGTLAGVVIVGESAPELRESISAASMDAACVTVEVPSMDEAVRKAASICPSPGIVLFSPACASFDMFEDYKDRGRAFKKAVEELKR